MSPAGQKVILTIRDSDDKWWKSWCGFFTQESKEHAIGDINLGIILNKASEHGYMGPKLKGLVHKCHHQKYREADGLGR